MGPASVDFVSKARRYATQNPTFRPAYLDFDAFVLDADALAGLAPLHQLLASLDLDPADGRLRCLPGGPASV